MVAVALGLAVGCGGDDGGDAPPDDGCLTDAECSDGIFCSGVERCVMGECAPGNDPCPAPLLCSESGGRCESPGCDVTVDADSDGHDAVACGGDDCDDTDPDRYPGNPEVCDAVDQDCDPTTLGGTDADDDGFVSVACCNGDRCGLDCDDAAAAVGPTGTEACNGVDDDCDGDVDEGVLRAFYPDVDRDNFGDRDGMPLFACAPMDGVAENTLDCDDGDPAINPTSLEQCNGVDDNCNGVTDDEAATAAACTASYGTPSNTFFACADSACSVASCAAGYADCNGEPSDGCETGVQSDPRNCGGCAVDCGVGGICTAGTCDGVVDVSAGNRYTCAVRSSGLVACWGANQRGQLGDLSVSDSGTPVLVSGVTRAVNVEASPLSGACPFTCAQSGTQLIQCWGCNRDGQVGDGDPEEYSLRAEPVNGVPTGMDIRPDNLAPKALTVGADFACALETRVFDDVAQCWGRDGTPMGCGDGAVCEAYDVQLPNPQSVVAGGSNICAVSDGDLYCVGFDSFGQLGNGPATGAALIGSPAQADPSFEYEQVAVGEATLCAILGPAHNGAVACWGLNIEGQVGDGTTAGSRNRPQVVAGTTNAVDVCVADGHACAVLGDGTARCWGRGNSGQLGNGGTASSRSPVTVDLTNIVQISCGFDHTCALDGAGDVWCWGSNDREQVGPGFGATVTRPVRVAGI
ncbi:MAG: hypothetical protein CMN30_03965 [Sandaracinus sp.]|nr:hypothetical protein [Sandaracinus sp.]